MRLFSLLSFENRVENILHGKSRRSSAVPPLKTLVEKNDAESLHSLNISSRKESERESNQYIQYPAIENRPMDQKPPLWSIEKEELIR